MSGLSRTSIDESVPVVISGKSTLTLLSGEEIFVSTQRYTIAYAYLSLLIIKLLLRSS